MSIGRAFADGIRRAGAAKRYLLVAYVVNLSIAMVLGLTMATAIEDSLGSSLAAGNLRDGFDALWHSGFSARASGLAETFHPSVVGVGAVFNGLDTFLQGGLFRQYPLIVGIGVLYLALWTFFAGGFISAFRRPREVHAASFFHRSARFFPRFAVLAVMAGVLYWLIFHFAMPWLDDRVASLTRETVDERVFFAWTMAKYLVVWCLVWLVSLVFDYGKILTVVHDHGNALTAPLKALGFVAKNLVRTVGLHLAIGIVWVALLVGYWAIAPGADQSTTAAVAVAFLLGQLYIVARIFTRCLFWAGQTAMYEALGAPAPAPREEESAAG